MRVLIVDDQAVMRRILVKLVQGAGVDECREAVSGHDALRILARTDVDLIITDWNMPNMTGLEFIRMVRTQARTKTIPVILVTTHNTENDLAAAMTAGITDYVVKPFTAATVIDKVKAILYPMLR